MQEQVDKIISDLANRIGISDDDIRQEYETNIKNLLQCGCKEQEVFGHIYAKYILKITLGEMQEMQLKESEDEEG